MKDMTSQEIFDRVFDHLIDQGGPAVDKGSCVYRTRDHKMCAVGCVIPDSYYHPDLEKLSAGLLNTKGDYFYYGPNSSVEKIYVHPDLSQFMIKHSGLLQILQYVHDSFDYSIEHEDTTSWKKYINREMQKVAIEFNLTFNERK